MGLLDDPPKSFSSLIVLIISGGLAVLCLDRYLPPFSWIADWQLENFGFCLQKLTCLVTAMLLMAPISSVAWLLKQAQLQATGASGATTEPPAPGQRRPWSPGEKLGLGTCAFGLALLCFAVPYFVKYQHAGPLTLVAIAPLESGDKPPSRYVKLVDAHLLSQQGMTLTKTPDEKEIFIPMVSQTWTGGPVSIYLAFDERGTDKVKTAVAAGELQGMLTEGGMPGAIQTDFSKSTTPPAQEYYLLELGVDPTEMARACVAGILICAVMAAAGILWWLYSASQASTKPPPPTPDTPG